MRFTLSYRRFSLPFRQVVRTAHGPWAMREGLLVRLADETGRTGYGEAAPIPWFGTETLAECESTLETLGPEADEETLAAVPARLGCLGAALAMARAAIVPAGATPAPARHGTLALAAVLPAGTAVLAAVERRLELGFRVFKWKVGVAAPEEELPLLDDLLACLPAGARVRLDANGAWDRRRAERWLAAAAERPVEFIEQPIAAGARGADDLLLGLAHDFPTPLALDESLAGPGDLVRWLDLGWPGWWVVKPSLLGDPSAALARLASTPGVAERVVFSSALETGVGARAALRLAARWPAGRLPALGFGVYPLFEDARFDGPLALAPYVRAADVEPGAAEEAAWNALS